MACIDNLFDGILEIIFKKLPLHYRLKCKEVCPRWCELLMTRAIFREDRHIYLSDCSIEPHRPPMSVFMKAKHPYDILTLKSMVSDDCKKMLEQNREFWRYLGQSITEMHFDIYWEPQFYKILYEMPQIEVVVVDHASLNTVANHMVQMQEESSNQEYPKSLKTLKTGLLLVGEWQETLDNFTKLRKIIPDNTEVIVSEVHIDQSKPLEDVFSFLQDGNVTCKTITIGHQINSILENLQVVKKLPFQSIELNYSWSENPSFDIIKAFFEQHENINELKLTCKFSPMFSTFTQMTELVLSGHSVVSHPFRSLKSLEPLVNLKSLSIYIKKENCPFRHEIVDMPKLTKFQSTSRDIRCSNCWTALACSFPNLSEFDGFVEAPNCSAILQLMFKNWRYLKVMRVRRTVSLDNFEKSLENLEGQRLFLRTLEIHTRFGSTYSGDDFLKMSKIFPHLNRLVIEINNRTDFESIIKAIVTGSKELSTLLVTTGYPIRNDKGNHFKCFKIETSSSVLEHLERNGHSLRRIDIPLASRAWEVDQKVIKLFESLHQLRSLNTVRHDAWISDVQRKRKLGHY